MRADIKKGFTLVEMIIVISIIAIIAAIAVPSMLHSRMAANEASAISCLRTVCTSQATFKRTCYNVPGYPAGVLCYARPFYILYNYTPPYNNPASTLGLIDQELATAHIAFPNVAMRGDKAGYQFYDLWFGLSNNMNGQWYPYNLALRWGATASPATYNLSGVNSFLINDSGVIYQCDFGTRIFHTGMYDDPTVNGYMAVE